MVRANNRGFTLIELMIAVAIIAIIMAVAYPSYLNHVRSSRRSSGESKLMEMMSAQERYYTENNTYATDLTKIGYSAATNVQSDGGWYKIKAAGCGGGISSCVTLTATAQNDQSNDTNGTDCTSLTLDSRGSKTPSACW